MRPEKVKKKKELPQALYDCKLMFINAAIVCCWKRHQEGTSLRRRHFFLSLLGIKTDFTVPYCNCAVSVADVKKRRATGKAAQAAYRSLRRKEKKEVLQ